MTPWAERVARASTLCRSCLALGAVLLAACGPSPERVQEEAAPAPAAVTRASPPHQRATPSPTASPRKLPEAGRQDRPLPSPPPAAASTPVRPARTAPVPAPRAAGPKPGARPALDVTDHDPIHDRSLETYRRLQRPSESLRGFPLDRLGRVDWVKALERGVIHPRADLRGKGKMQIRDQDLVMKDTRQMPWVIFPHKAHTEWLACKNCHPRPFIARAGANPITMDGIFRGKHCGYCHDRVAFSTFICERCHSVLRKDDKRWW